MNDYISDLCCFLDDSPVNFFAAETIRQRLEAAGFRRLDMRDRWQLKPGDKCYVMQNGSAIFAFVAGNGGAAAPCDIIAAHSDSPGFRIKPKPEIEVDGIGQLNTEVYGGPILYTWFDRPLSIAGRVALRSDDPLNPRLALIRFDKPMLTIPHLAIHFNRQVNDGNPLSKQKDMLPVVSLKGHSDKNYILNLLCSHLEVEPEEILDYDLSLYVSAKACTVGLENDMIMSGRLDDLSMAHAAMTALVEEADKPSAHTRVMAIFDNEETGSGTKQGAASPILKFILQRITAALGGDDTYFMRAVAGSFMISADNAHGFHPNYASKYDPTNHPQLGHGPCIKTNANCKYMTDADSAAVFRAICERAGVPCQSFVNHSDIAGGSTLGNILTSQLPLRGVDMGAPLWAMHSACETASTADHIYTIQAFKCFYSLYDAND